MADSQDLHQIEYRHHQTKDLSPVASSMTSRESLAGGMPDSGLGTAPRCRHAVGKRVLPSVLQRQAALAWRYWDARVASREDGTLGGRWFPVFSSAR